MKKKCLFLLIAFAAAGANVRAQKTVTDYDGLKTAVDKVNSIPELQKTVADKKEIVEEKTAAIAPLQKDVDNANTVLAGLMANPQYPTSGTKTGKMDNPFLVEINNFLTVVRREMTTQGSSGVTKEEAGKIKIYYRVRKNVTMINKKITTTFFLDITTADFVGLESQKNQGWIPVDATIAFDAELVKEEYEGETFEYFSYPNDIALEYNGSNVVLGNGFLTLSIYYCPVDVETDSENGKKNITFVDSEQSILKSGLGMSGDEATFLGFVDAMAEITTSANFPPVEYDEPIPNENYQSWLNDVQAAKEDLGYKDETTGEWVVGGKSKLLEEAQAALKTAKEKLQNAEAAVTEAEKYKTLTVEGNADIEVSETLGVWPADGEIMGNYNRVITPANTPLFSRNDGTILNLIAQDGRIATTNGNGAVVKDCIVKVSSSEYRVYDDNGVYKPYSTLVDAVYSMRDYFGYDVMRKVATGKVDAKTKLYQANYANANQQDVYSFKVNLKQEVTGKDAFIYNTEDAPNYMKTGFTLDNSVIYLDNTDVPETVKTMPNVVVRNTNGKYVCSKMILIEGMNGDNKTQEFYIPYDFSTENLNYERNITTNTVAVCLPFALTDDIRTQLASKAEGAGTNEAWFYTFKEIRGTSMYFNISESIGANKPCIIAFKEGVMPGKIFDGLSVDFKSTSGAVLASKSTNEDVTRFFGNYKAGQYAGDLALMYSDLYTGSAVYGFQGGELVKMNDKMVDGQRVGSKLHQFRSYVRHKEDLTAGTTPKSFRVCLLDENGNEVTGIGSVESDKGASSFKAVGGNGAIAISADKACEVKVYTASGALTKTLRVEAGNTTLPLSAGIYIVNQTKVVVK